VLGIEEFQRRNVWIRLEYNTGTVVLRYIAAENQTSSNGSRRRPRFRHRIPFMIDAVPAADWNGSSTELGELFVMRRGRREIRCKLFSHQSGWELRLVMGVRADVMLDKVCASQDDVLRAGEQWKTALIDKGWVQFL